MTPQACRAYSLLMSAYVTYMVTVFDADGVELGSFPVRAVCPPTADQAMELATEQYGNASAVEVRRSIPAKIGHVTPAARRVSARVRVLA